MVRCAVLGVRGVGWRLVLEKFSGFSKRAGINYGATINLTKLRSDFAMADTLHWSQTLPFQPESWRERDASDYEALHPEIREQTRILELLGRVNYKIIEGKRVYVEVDGVVYKTLYGGYWRSVFTGIEHHLLRCVRVSGSVWADENSPQVDLPIAYSQAGWTACGRSLSFILSREMMVLPTTHKTWIGTALHCRESVSNVFKRIARRTRKLGI